MRKRIQMQTFQINDEISRRLLQTTLGILHARAHRYHQIIVINQLVKSCELQEVCTVSG